MVVDDGHFQERRVLRQRALQEHVLNPGTAHFSFLSCLTVRLDGRCAIGFLRCPRPVLTGEVPVRGVVHAHKARLHIRVVARADHRDIRHVARAVVVRLNRVAVFVDQVPQKLVALRKPVVEFVLADDLDALLAQLEDRILIHSTASCLIAGALEEMIDLAGGLANLLDDHARDVLGEVSLSLSDLREIIEAEIRRLPQVRDLLRGVSDAAGQRGLAGLHAALAQLGGRETHQDQLVNGARTVNGRRVLVSVVLGELQADAVQVVHHVDDTHRHCLQARLDGRAVAAVAVEDHQARQRRIHVDVLEDTEAGDRLHELGTDTQVTADVRTGLQERRVDQPPLARLDGSNRVRRYLSRQHASARGRYCCRFFAARLQADRLRDVRKVRQVVTRGRVRSRLTHDANPVSLTQAIKGTTQRPRRQASQASQLSLRDLDMTVISDEAEHRLRDGAGLHVISGNRDSLSHLSHPSDGLPASAQGDAASLGTRVCSCASPATAPPSPAPAAPGRGRPSSFRSLVCLFLLGVSCGKNRRTAVRALECWCRRRRRRPVRLLHDGRANLDNPARVHHGRARRRHQQQPLTLNLLDERRVSQPQQVRHRQVRVLDRELNDHLDGPHARRSFHAT